jgi:hypothetical protein
MGHIVGGEWNERFLSNEKLDERGGQKEKFQAQTYGRETYFRAVNDGQNTTMCRLPQKQRKIEKQLSHHST